MIDLCLDNNHLIRGNLLLTRFNKRHMKRTIVMMIAIMLAAQIPVVKELLARGAARLYTAAKYPGQTITFKHFEYKPYFGNYIISYICKRQMLCI